VISIQTLLPCNFKIENLVEAGDACATQGLGRSLHVISCNPDS